MRTVADLRAKLTRRYLTHHPRWAGEEALGADAAYAWPLQPPTEREMADDPEQVAAWVGQWRAAERRTGIKLEWVQRRWSSFGSQSLPNRVVVTGAPAIAAMAGHAATWDRLCAVVRRLRAKWPDTDYLGDALTARAKALTALGDPDLDRLIALVDWLVAHPDSQLLPRQLPVPGLDTKWYERHHRVVHSLAAAITGSSDVGLAGEAQRFRVRILDPALAISELTDFTATVAELAKLDRAAPSVLIIENLTSLAALPEFDGMIALHGRGFAVTQLAQIPWVTGAPVLLYWGDLDSYGFEILKRCRAALPQSRSVLMDRRTLARFRERAGTEPRPYRAEIDTLTPEEAATLATLRESDARLEQERIDPAYAIAGIVEALASESASLGS